MLHQIHYAVKQGCVRLRNALRCISEAIFTFTTNQLLNGACFGFVSVLSAWTASSGVFFKVDACVQDQQLPDVC